MLAISSPPFRCYQLVLRTSKSPMKLETVLQAFAPRPESGSLLRSPQQTHLILGRARLRVGSGSTFNLKWGFTWTITEPESLFSCSPSLLLWVVKSSFLIQVLWKRLWLHAAQQPRCRNGHGSPGCIAVAHTWVSCAPVLHPGSRNPSRASRHADREWAEFYPTYWTQTRDF